MKSDIFLLAIFASVLHVVQAKINHAQEFESKALSHIKKRSITDETESCYDDLSLDETVLLEEFQDKTVNCKQDAEEEMEGFSIKELRVVAAEKVKNIQKSLQDCNFIENTSEYLECLKNFDSKSREVLDEIKQKSEDFQNQFNRIEEKEYDCQKETLEQSKLKSQTSLLNLKLCLKERSTSTVNYVDELKKIYKDLEICTKNDDFSRCMKTAKEISTDKQLKGYFEQNAARHYEELTRIDQLENTCMRHFITECVFPEFNGDFNLKQCVRFGLTQATYKEYPRLLCFQEFINLRKLLFNCTLASNGANADECASRILKTSFEGRYLRWLIHQMEEHVQNEFLSEILDIFKFYETECIRYIFEGLQFKGLFMNISAKQSLKECLKTESVPSDLVIVRLKEIANSFTVCCSTPLNGDYFKCTDDAVAASRISLDYITTEPRYSNEYIKDIETDDSGEHNFLQILNGYKNPPYIEIMDAFHCLLVE